MDSSRKTFPATATNEPAMFSVAGFCNAHAISRAMLYKLRHDGKAPRMCKVGTRTLISAEAAADWRRGLEQCPRAAA